MQSKLSNVIDYLLKCSDYVPAERIISDCNISERTFYNYLKSLKEDNDYIVDTTSKGIKLIKKQSAMVINIPQDYEERKTFIYRKGLISHQSLVYSKLIDYFGISESTLHNEIIKIRNEIRKFHVRLVLKDDELIFVGNYHNLKKLTQNIIYKENNQNQSMLSISKLQEIFPELDVDFALSSITNELTESNYFMDEYSILNLLLHILISLNQEIDGIVPINIDENVENDVLINKICKPLEDKYDFKFSNNAKRRFSLILNSRIKKNESDESLFKNKETAKLSQDIFDNLYASYNLDMNVSDLKTSFMLHIDSLISRLKNNVTLNNPLLSVIKQSSPITYDIAVNTANMIKNKTNYSISESEIAYIALHIGTRIEEIKSARTRLNVVMVCPEYYGYNSGLNKIIEIYNDDLYVSNVLMSFDELEKVNLDIVDLIICTSSPNRSINNVRVLKISSFLTSNDRKEIGQTIIDIKKENMLERNKNSIYSLFQKNLFFSNMNFSNKEAVLDFLSDNLLRYNLVSDDYKDAVKYREEIAPTDFNMIAIPHPAEYSAQKTVISVCILDKPINWGRSEVSIIMMIAVNAIDFNAFDDMLSAITQIAIDSTKVKELRKQKTYEDFIGKLEFFLNKD